MRRGLFIGRFQPIHLGHHLIIKEILDECDEIVLVVAAAQESFNTKNPFTASERLVMLRTVLLAENIDLSRVWLIPVQNIYDNDLWVNHLLRMIPPIEIVYGNNPFTTLLFENQGIRVKPTKIYSRELYEARQIREKLAKGESVEGMIHDQVISFLESINAGYRLKSLYETDSSKFDGPNSEIA